ncbi:MAG: YraN family protein [Clostridiales bacterium]|nr:YraN family protein [Candidatus Apopatousia equi]
MNTKVLGTKGEVEAKEFLIKKGYKILETNYTTKLGEIDIIAKQKDVIVFVEVKARETLRYGLPREAITPYKQNKIRRVATLYLKIKNQITSKVRFDCIDILGDKITHIENCF